MSALLRKDTNDQEKALYREPCVMKRTEEERKQAADEIVKSKSGNNIEKVTDRYMKTIESMGLSELKFMQSDENYRHDCALTQPVLIAFNTKCMKIEDGAKQIAEENKKLYSEYEEVWDNY
jgi:hypothetical protein